jgi:hypothetical protein
MQPGTEEDGGKFNVVVVIVSKQATTNYIISIFWLSQTAIQVDYFFGVPTT